MNELLLSSIAMRERPLAHVAAVAAAARLDGVEVTARAPHLDAADGEPAAVAARAALGAVPAVVYGSYLGRPDVWGEQLVAREVAIASVLGARFLRVWAEPPDGAGFDDAVALLRRVGDEAAAAGIWVVVERHVGSLCADAAGVERLLDEVDHPNVALNYQVLDFLPVIEGEQLGVDARRLASRARYAHVKNYRIDGERMAPWASVRDGAVDYRAVVGALLDEGYDGPIGIEFLAPGLDAPNEVAADAAFLRDVLAERIDA